MKGFEMEPFPRPVKSKSTGIGLRKDPSKPKKPMKWASKKQAKRTDNLHVIFEEILKVQDRMYGHRFCWAGAGEWKDRCPNNKPEGRKYPLVPDHVYTRNRSKKIVDKPSSLQGLCSWCNYQKGSKRIDFRPGEYFRELEILDTKEIVCPS